MSNFKNQIDRELREITYECDIEQIHRKYKKRTKIQLHSGFI